MADCCACSFVVPNTPAMLTAFEEDGYDIEVGPRAPDGTFPTIRCESDSQAGGGYDLAEALRADRIPFHHAWANHYEWDAGAEVFVPGATVDQDELATLYEDACERPWVHFDMDTGEPVAASLASARRYVELYRNQLDKALSDYAQAHAHDGGR